MRKETKMSPETITTGGLRETSEPRTTPGEDGEFAVNYEPLSAARRFTVPISPAPPESYLLRVEGSFENGVYFLRAVEVDVAVEEEKLPDALRSLTDAVRDWLEYLAEERPALTPDLEEQRRYTRLLHYDSDTWFR
jgi:hypothetical protein